MQGAQRSGRLPGGTGAGATHADRLDRLAHELSNLLGVVTNYATLLGRQLHDQAALADVGQIQAAAQRGAELVRDLGELANRRDV